MIEAEAMNSVTEKKQRRPVILTEPVLASIPMLVEQGLNTEAIAARLGCTVGTLKVRCSQARISLRVPKELKVVPLVPRAVTGQAARAAEAEAVLCVCLADHTETQPSCHVTAAPAGGSHRRERSPTCQ